MWFWRRKLKTNLNMKPVYKLLWLCLGELRTHCFPKGTEFRRQAQIQFAADAVLVAADSKSRALLGFPSWVEAILPDRIDKALHILHRRICLNDVGWCCHVAATSPEDCDFRYDVSLDLQRSSEGQKSLLVDGSPERKLISKFVLQFLRGVPRSIGLNRP